MFGLAPQSTLTLNRRFPKRLERSGTVERDGRDRDTCSSRGCEEIVVVFRDRDIGGAAMNSVEDLDVFKLSHELALKIYSVDQKFLQGRNLQPG